MITLILQQGRKVRYTYLLIRQMRAVLHPYQNLGLVSPGWIILHHITLPRLLPSWFHVVKATIKKDQYMMKSPTNMAILSIMMLLQIRSIAL